MEAIEAAAPSAEEAVGFEEEPIEREELTEEEIVGGEDEEEGK